MVAIPSHAAAHVEEKAGEELENRGDFIRQAFGGMEMSGIEAIKDLIFYGVSQIEFMGTDDVGFGADAKKFALNSVEVQGTINGGGEDVVEGGGEAFAGCFSICDEVFRAIGDPDVGDGGRTYLTRDVCSDMSAGDAVFDPKLADAWVGMGEGKAIVGEGMGEKTGVEVEAEFAFPTPIDPALKMCDGVGVAVDFGSLEIGIQGMQIKPVSAGDEGIGLVEIGSQLLQGACFAGVIAGGLNATAGERGIGFFKAADIVSLPAMEGNGDAGESGKSDFGLNAETGVRFLGERVGSGHG